MVRDLPGPVLELGLGNGRTFDHMREILPDREIFVFDRRMAAHPDCVPDETRLVLGDIRETLPGAMSRIGAPAALAHCDIGTGDREENLRLAAFIGPALDALMVRGGVVVSDQYCRVSGWSPVALPPGVTPGRYHVHRVGPA